MSLIPNLLPPRDGWEHAVSVEAAGCEPRPCQQVLVRSSPSQWAKPCLFSQQHSGCALPAASSTVWACGGAVLSNSDVGALLGTVMVQREAWLHCMLLCIGSLP